MKFADVSCLFRDRPFFETAELVAMFDEPKAQVQARLSRWVAHGRLLRLRRGCYLLAPEYARRQPSEYHISNYLLRPSYVSLHSALDFHGLIPEAVHLIEALTPKHGGEWKTPLGTFRYHSIRQDRFFGYRRYAARIVPGSAAPSSAPDAFLMALPEKALLDVIYLGRSAWSRARVAEMRFQHLEELDKHRLMKFAHRFDSPKVRRGAETILAVHPELGTAVEHREHVA